MACRGPEPAPFRVMGSLPFGATTALLRHLFDEPDGGLRRADLIVQWEVARKRAATPPAPCCRRPGPPGGRSGLDAASPPIRSGPFLPSTPVSSAWSAGTAIAPARAHGRVCHVVTSTVASVSCSYGGGVVSARRLPLTEGREGEVAVPHLTLTFLDSGLALDKADGEPVWDSDWAGLERDVAGGALRAARRARRRRHRRRRARATTYTASCWARTTPPRRRRPSGIEPRRTGCAADRSARRVAALDRGGRGRGAGDAMVLLLSAMHVIRL